MSEVWWLFCWLFQRGFVSVIPEAVSGDGLDTKRPDGEFKIMGTHFDQEDERFLTRKISGRGGGGGGEFSVSNYEV